MVDFDLGERFDVVTCLFSSIGYVGTVERLERALACMARHLRPDGLLVVEPWLTPQAFRPGAAPHAVFVDQPDLKAARFSEVHLEGRLSRLVFQYLVGGSEGIEYFTETHVLALFTRQGYLAAGERAGLEVRWEEGGLTGRGLLVGVRGS